MARNFIILSLGQLTKSDWKKSIHAFTALSVSQSRMPHFIAYPLYFLRTLAVYGWDMSFGNHYINKYKLGQQHTDGFVSFLRSRFGGTDEQLKAAWNAMCVVDNASLQDIQTAITLSSQDLEVQKDERTNVRHNVIPVVVSATNQLHLKFIKEQVKKGLNYEKSQLDSIKLDSFFASVTKSYDANTLNQNELANTALAKLQPTDGTDRIISLHSGIKPNGCTLQSRFDPSKAASLDKVVKSLTSAFGSGTSVYRGN